MSDIKLYNDNCLKIIKEITDNSVDCIVTDPPYACTPHGTSGMGGICGNNKLSQSGKLFNFNNISPKDYASEFYRILKDGTHAYIMTNNLNLQEMMNEFTRVGFKFIKLLVWHKDNKIANQYYMQSLEFILFLRKGKEKRINNCGDSDFCEFPNKKMKDEEGNPLHPTEKPIELMKKFILNSTNENDTVIDPFMGIGATAIACKQTNRNFIGCEIDPKYFDIAKSRIEHNGDYVDNSKEDIFGI